MHSTGKWMKIIILLVIVAQLLAACAPRTPEPQSTPAVPDTDPTATIPAGEEQPAQPTAAQETPTEAAAETPEQSTGEAVNRKGGWLDTITVVEEATSEAAVSRIQAGEIDLHTQAMADPELLEQIKNDPNLKVFSSAGTNDDITFNPAGPIFEGTGKLNPFSVAKIREAMNWLIDRNYIGQEIMGGLGQPKILPLTAGFPEYVRYIEKSRELEAKYAYNPDKAREVVTAEMEALGAALVDGKWQYNGEPVELIGIIRTEDERREIGDYFANQLETIGFTVRRDYKKSSEASPIWYQGNPADGLFHFYTGGWINNWVARDEASSFDDYYNPRSPYGSPLWLAYKPTPEFDEISNRLKRSDFKDMEERKQLFERAMELALEDSSRIFVVDELSYSPMRSDILVAGDLAASIQGGMLWPFTLRREGEVGGELTMSNSQILVEPWNPIGGSNFVTDAMVQRATGDRAAVMDPFTGLSRPQRMERGEVFVTEGFPMIKTLDWVDLHFVPEVTVPGDAWVDWDAKEQRWITADEKFPDGLKARAKLVAYYPESIYDIQWHDGSRFSLADILFGWVMGFDPAKPDSPIFDPSVQELFEANLEAFKGYRVVSEHPLVLEKYTDIVWMDAEENFFQWSEFWTEYTFGNGAWHNISLGVLAETNNELAFTSGKADENGVEWMSFVSGPSLDILKKHLDQAAADNYIPYAPFLGKYITADEAKARWSNLQTWYQDHGHFWIGTGPYYLDKVFPVENILTLKHNPNYIDPADKWSIFSEPKFPEVEIDGPGRVTIGQEASFDVYVDFKDEPYPQDEIDLVKVLVYDSEGQLVLSDEAEAVEDGLWRVTLTAEETAKLTEGSNRLEVAAASRLVSFPSFAELEFVTVP